MIMLFLTNSMPLIDIRQFKFPTYCMRIYKLYFSKNSNKLHIIINLKLYCLGNFKLIGIKLLNIASIF